MSDKWIVCCPHDHDDGTECCGAYGPVIDGQRFRCGECGGSAIADFSTDRGARKP